MTSIERTAYPKLENNISKKELIDTYTASMDEINHIHTVVRGKTSKINYLVLLKCFQNLGYFPSVKEISFTIVKHIKCQLKLDCEQKTIIYDRNNTLYEHHKMIRKYLNIKQYNEQAKNLLIEVVTKNSYIMNNPADLINSAIDVLIKNKVIRFLYIQIH